MLRRRRSPDRGFTLIELTIAITILSIIVVALIGVLFVYVRNANDTNTRMTASTDQQFVSAYWQTDVSSLGMRTAPVNGVVGTGQAVWAAAAGTTITAPSGLPGLCASHANTVIAFEWTDYKTVPSGNPTAAWSPSTNDAAVYYTQPVTNSNGTSQTQLWRMRCGGQVSNLIVARHLTGVPTVACAANDGSSAPCSNSNPFPATASITLVVKDRSLGVNNNTGYTTTLTANRRQG